MTWILLPYGAFLCYLLLDGRQITNRESFRKAWILFAAIPLSDAVLTLFRTFSIESLIRVEIWADGFAWLFFGFSFLAIFNAFGEETGNANQPTPVAAYKTCLNCLTENQPSAAKCESCGNELRSV